VPNVFDGGHPGRIRLERLVRLRVRVQVDDDDRGWPLVHVCSGIDPVTMRLRVARGIVAIGNVAVGVLAIGGVAIGLLTVGGGSIGILMAIGGAALGLGVSVGGFALGSVAIGGAAVGFIYAIGGGAVGPAVIDGLRCDEAARDFARRWLNMLPPSCR
jgi:hypothetical protein